MAWALGRSPMASPSARTTRTSVMKVAFLVFHRSSAFAGRIEATPSRRDDHGLAAGEALRSLLRVLEGAAHLSNTIDPRLELAGDGKVVERSAHNDHVGFEELAHEPFRDRVFALLDLGQTFRPGGHAKAERADRQMARSVDCEVEAGWLARHLATIFAVNCRDIELVPRTLESMWSSFMIRFLW
jgi:hypothetical protein